MIAARRVDAVLRAALLEAGVAPARAFDEAVRGGGQPADVVETGSRVRTTLPIWPGGGRVLDFAWGVVGDLRLGEDGLAVTTMPLGVGIRWAGPGSELVLEGAAFTSRERGGMLVIDGASWPETLLAACAGRPLAAIVGHRWLGDPRLVATRARAGADGRHVVVEAEAVMIDLD